MAYFGKVDLDNWNPFLDDGYDYIKLENWIKTYPQYKWEFLENYVMDICGSFANMMVTPLLAAAIQGELYLKFQPLVKAKLINSVPEFRVWFEYDRIMKIYVRK